VRYTSIRWLVGLLALTLLGGSYALHALFAQDRAATPPSDPRSITNSAAKRHWWDEPESPPASGVKQVSASKSTKANEPKTMVFRLKRDQAGDAKPVVLDADEITSWTEKSSGNDYCVFLMRGLVLAQQGVIQARFDQGVAWVDVGRYKITGKLHVQLYVEGKVRIDDGSTLRDLPRAILDLTTCGEFKLHTHRSPLAQKTLADDPLVKRARAEGLGAPARRQPDVATRPAPTPPLLRTSHEQEQRLLLPPTVTPTPAPNLQPVPPAAQPRGSVAPLAPVERVSKASPPVEPFLLGASTPGGPTTYTAGQPGAVSQPPGPEGPANGAPRQADGSVPPSGPTRVPPGTPPLSPPSKPTPPPGKGGVAGPARNFMISPRQGGSFQGKIDQGPNGESIYVVTGGVILQVRNAPNVGMMDMEADRVIIWTKGDGKQLSTNIQQPSGHTSNDLEVYLSGHVVIRQSPLVNPKGEQRTISANEVYYDVNRNVAVAKDARLELKQPLTPDPVIATCQELRQTSINTFEVVKAEVFSSKLPSDPGLKVYLSDGVIEDKQVPLKNLFGQPVMDRKTGQPVTTRETLLTGHNVVFELEDVPFFYLPYISTNVQEPLGPLQDFNFGYNHLFGIQLGLTLNVYELLGLQPRPNTRWQLNLDYLSYRGPGVGTVYDYHGTELFGVPAKYTGQFKGFGMSDRNFDILGALRPINNFEPTNFRGWGLWTNAVEDMPYGFSFLSQVSGLSDRNFLEQYYKRVFDLNPNQATFLFLKEQQDNWAWSALVEPRIRNWVTETQSLPRLDGWLIGQDLFERLTYNTHVNLEYVRLATSTDNLPPVSSTDVPTNTARASWMQELLLPVYAGPIKFLPYARLETTGYSSDINGDAIGRVWGAGGVRASIPFTHLYRDVQSELWNLNGLNHKIVASVNYAYASTNEPFTTFAQLDRLNDDATDQALRDINTVQFLVNPQYGVALANNALYKPQTYAIRNLLWDRIDTLNTVEVAQFDVRQRLQTKRGFPGNQHIVDWMVLDLSASYFPAENRDNFGHPFAFLAYNYLWNVGDRTALNSTATVDPFPGGPKVWTIGGYFNRPPRTNIYLGFREIYPLNSRAITGAVTYVFSPKYAMTASSTYDFGTSEALSNSLMFTRMGSDLQVSLGFTYNALQNNFGVLFNIIPNLLPANRAVGPISGAGGGSMGVLK
jgi:hypothetical protein